MIYRFCRALLSPFIKKPPGPKHTGGQTGTHNLNVVLLTTANIITQVRAMSIAELNFSKISELNFSKISGTKIFAYPANASLYYTNGYFKKCNNLKFSHRKFRKSSQKLLHFQTLKKRKQP